MRVRAGVILIEEGRVALIERYRDGRHYYVFPGGGADDSETPREAALREMEEETGLRVTIKRKVAEIHFGFSTQHYFLADRVSGEYGTGAGEEFVDADPEDPTQGEYLPIWMALGELEAHENVYPVDVKDLVMKSVETGWPDEPILVKKY